MISQLLVPVIPTTSSVVAPKSSPRGVKRSRSPEQLGDLPLAGGADEGMSITNDAINRPVRGAECAASQ